MKILVCFKIVEEFDDVLDSDWQADHQNQLDLTYAKKIFSCFDESALRIALGLQKVLGTVKITALTVGNGDYPPLLKNLAAMGISDIQRICWQEDIRFSPDTVAEIIAEYIKKNGGYDLILMGVQASGGENSTTPLILAELLNLPVVCNAVDIWEEEGRLIVSSQIDKGIEKIQSNRPMVVTVGSGASPYLPLATLREKLKVKDFKEKKVALKIHKPSSKIKLRKIYNETTDRNCHRMEPESPLKAAELIIQLFKEGN